MNEGKIEQQRLKAAILHFVFYLQSLFSSFFMSHFSAPVLLDVKLLITEFIPLTIHLTAWTDDKLLSLFI